MIGSQPYDAGARTLVGCGRALPDQRIVIADPETMTRCEPDRIGEIWTAGPSIAQGYWGRPEASEETFHAYLRDTGEGPFLRTGDLGFLCDGELFVTGRIKDLIILHGVNIYPQDIERTVQQCDPRLRSDSGAAFAVEIDGREQLAVVQEFERRGDVDTRRLFDSIRRAISADHEIPVAAIVLIKAGTIPKTSSGKIQRRACREALLGESLAIVDQWFASRSPSGAAADERTLPAVVRPASGARIRIDPAHLVARSVSGNGGTPSRTSGMHASNGIRGSHGKAKPLIDIVLEERSRTGGGR